MALLNTQSKDANSASFQAFGREVELMNFDKGVAISQADLNALVEEVTAQNVSITAIGDFNAGVSTAVNMIIEGHGAVVATGYTVAPVAF